MLELVSAYQPAIMALIVLTLIVLLQSFAGAFFCFVKGDKVPGAPLTGDHGELGFRSMRCYQNGVENLPAFAVALFIAIAAGAGASLVNMLAIIHVGFRVLYMAIYYSGYGKPAGGPRSLTYVAGWAVNVVLVVIALLALM